MSDWFDKVKAEDIETPDVETPERSLDDYPVRMIINCGMATSEDLASSKALQIMKRILYVLNTSSLICDWKIVKMDCPNSTLTKLSTEYNLGYVIHEELLYRLETQIYLIPDKTEYSVQDMVRVMQFTNKICRILNTSRLWYLKNGYGAPDIYFAYIRKGFNRDLPMTININTLVQEGLFSTLDLSDILCAFNCFTKVKSTNELYEELQMRFLFANELAYLYDREKDEYCFPCTIETWDRSDPGVSCPDHLPFVIRGKTFKQLSYHYYIINKTATFIRDFYLSCQPPKNLKLTEFFDATEPKHEDHEAASQYITQFTGMAQQRMTMGMSGTELADYMSFEFSRMMDYNIKYQTAVNAAQQYVQSQKEEKSYLNKHEWL